jgi:hypothetical protein
MPINSGNMATSFEKVFKSAIPGAGCFVGADTRLEPEPLPIFRPQAPIQRWIRGVAGNPCRQLPAYQGTGIGV